MNKTTTGNPAISAVTRVVAFTLSVGLLTWLAWPMICWLGWVFRYPKDDMGHGWLVPIFSAYLLWMRRRELREAVGAPSWIGAALCLPGVLLLWLGERGGQVRLSQASVYWLLWCLTYAFWGRGVARLTAFPVIYLLFTVPLAFLDVFTVRLRMLTAMLSSGLLNGIGVPVARVGTGLRSLAGAGFSLDVADPCSGLRSIFAMTAITAAYAYLTQRRLWQKWLLFACSVPLAIVGNMARIFTIALVAKYCGQDAGTGFYHDYSGYLVFVVGTLLMVQVGAWISRLDTSAPHPPDTAPDVPAAPAAPSGARAYLSMFGVPLLLLSTGLLLHGMPSPVIEPQDFLASRLPDSLGALRGAQPWYCRNEQCLSWIEDPADSADPAKPPTCPQCHQPLYETSLGEHTVLPADTLFLKRNYYDPMGGVFRVTVVVNGASRQSIHRPELCLPTQGFYMERTEIVALPLSDSGSLDVKLVDVRRGGPGGRSRAMGQAYFFLSARHATASHYVRILTSVRDRAFANRVTRWAMVTITADAPFDTTERREALRVFVDELLKGLRVTDDRRGLPDDGPQDGVTGAAHDR
ncbi:MAG: exosortase/archaeosortase family protein [Kiritimatiellae bacterium]|nr:exosortase/archaeosortase family protein [Kiritimatiellia bacterium]